MAERIAGINSVLEALHGSHKIHRIYVQEGRTAGKRMQELLALAEKKGVYCKTIDRAQIDRMYTAGNHQGVVAEVESYRYAELDELFARAEERHEDPFFVILDGLEDPHNLGAIIRTAECAGVHGIILPKHHSVEVNATVHRTSAGAVTHMLVAQETNLVTCLQQLKDRGMWIIGADMDGEETLYEAVIPFPAAVVIGNEGRGLRPLVKKQCDLVVRIPMFGTVNSLNASNAAALMIYELVRRRRQGETQYNETGGIRPGDIPAPSDIACFLASAFQP